MLRRVALIVLVWLAALACWEGAYRVIGWRAWVFPAPSHVVDASLRMLNIDTYFGEDLHPGWPWLMPGTEGLAPPPREGVLQSQLVKAVGISAVRLAIGFALSLLLGCVLGVVMWRFEFVDALLGPLFLGLQTLPSVVWVPLSILTFGITETGIVFVLVMGSFFAVAIALRDGMRQIPPIYRFAALMLGARRYRLYRFALLPASLPALASSLRQGFAFSWRSLMGAELIFMVSRRGVGFLLNVGREFADVAQVVSVMVVMVVIGMLADRLVFAVLERRIRARFGLSAPS